MDKINSVKHEGESTKKSLIGIYLGSVLNVYWSTKLKGMIQPFLVIGCYPNSIQRTFGEDVIVENVRPLSKGGLKIEIVVMKGAVFCCYCKKWLRGGNLFCRFNG